MQSHDMTRSPFKAVLAGLFDESILVREARRWRYQNRWGLLAMAVLIGGVIAAMLFGQLLFDWGHPGENLNLPQGLFGSLMAALTLLGSLLGFYQSMQALRREVHTQTLEGLFLTLQTDRGVILAVAASGVIVGGTFQLIFFPIVLFAAIALAVNPLQMAAALALMFASLILAAAIGACWFFVSQQLFEVKSGFRRIALHVIGLGAFGAVVAHFTPVWWVPARLAIESVWVCILYCLAGTIVWSLRTILTESKCLASSTGDASPWKPAPQARAMTVAAAGLTGVILLCLSYILPHASDAQLSFNMPVANLGFLFAPAAVGDLLASSPTASPGWLAVLLASTAGLAAATLLLGMGVTAAGCQLYRRLRTMPEIATGFSSRPLQVVNVGRDDWRGFGNPVLTRELRTRLRSGDAQTFILIATLLSVAALVIPLLSSLGGSITPPAVADLARTGFVSVAIIQLVIAWLIGSGVGSEMISMEREKKTFEMLQASRLTERQILWGRVIGCWALLLLLASPAFPLLALGAFLHGLTPAAVLITIVSIAAFTFLISMTSVCISALARSSVAGKWTAYALGLVFGAIFTAVPLSLASTGGSQVIAVAAGSAIVLGLIFIFVVAPLWYLAIARIRSDGSRVRGGRFRLPRLRRMLARLHRRPVLQMLTRTATWVLIVMLCAGGILKLVYHGTDSSNDFSNPTADINTWLRLAFADGPSARSFRSEIAHAYRNLDRERTAAESEGLLVPLEKLQAPIPPDSQNAAPDYRRLMALLKSKPLGMYGEPAVPASHSLGAGYPGGMGTTAVYPAAARPGPVGPLYVGKPRAGDGAQTDMDTIVSYIGTKDSSPSQEAAVREMLRQRQDIMGLIRQATEKPYCVFARPWSKGWNVLLPEYATMREAARLLKAESYMLAKQGRYKDAVEEQSRGFRLAEHAASDPVLISYLVGIACDAISVKGMESILYLSGPNVEVSGIVRDAMIKNQPRFSVRHAMMGEISTSSAMFEDARSQSGRTSELLQDVFEWGNDSSAMSSSNDDNSFSARLFQAALRTPGVSMLLWRLMAATEAQMIHDEIAFTADSALSYPEQKVAMDKRARGKRDLIQVYAQALDSFFGPTAQKEVNVRAREEALIGGASVLHYRASQGRLPANLADAGPVPIDPFTDHAMGYHQDGDRFVVFSRGTSGSFNGGVLLGFDKTQRGNSSGSNVVFAPSDNVVAAALKSYREEAYFVYPEIPNGS